MTPDDRERMHILCQRLAVEEGHSEFTKLVEEMNELLAREESRLKQDRVRPKKSD
jgi:hypothetical protein